MTKKGYVLIAKVLKGTIRLLNETPIKEELINNFVLALSLENPRFNEKIFRENCKKEVKT